MIEYKSLNEENTNFSSRYTKVKKKTEILEKKNNLIEHNRATFSEIISKYTQKGYKIPDLSVKNNLFEPSPLLMENTSLNNFYKLHSKNIANSKEIQFLQNLGNTVNSKVSNQDEDENENKFDLNKYCSIHLKTLKKKSNSKENLEKTVKEHTETNESLKRIINENNLKESFDLFNTNINNKYDNQKLRKHLTGKINLRSCLKKKALELENLNLTYESDNKQSIYTKRTITSQTSNIFYPTVQTMAETPKHNLVVVDNAKLIDKQLSINKRNTKLTSKPTLKAGNVVSYKKQISKMESFKSNENFKEDKSMSLVSPKKLIAKQNELDNIYERINSKEYNAADLENILSYLKSNTNKDYKRYEGRKWSIKDLLHSISEVKEKVSLTDFEESYNNFAIKLGEIRIKKDELKKIT